MSEVTGPGPVAAAARIDTLDVLRGIAICGILLMNIPTMGMLGELGQPDGRFAWNADWIAWMAQHLFFEGTMRGLFTMLFGAGMLLMLRRAEGAPAEVTPIDVWTRRCLMLMLLGVVQCAVFLWPGEILWTYGLVGLALLAFRTARPRTLLTAALILLVGLTCWQVKESRDGLASAAAGASAMDAKGRGAKLSEEQEAALRSRARRQEYLQPTPTQRIEEYRRRTSFPAVVGWSTGLWADWNLDRGSWAWIAESLCFMLIGMALFRTGILTGSARPAIYRLMMLGGYGGGLAIRLVGLHLQARTGFAVSIDHPDAGATLWQDGWYETARLLITLGYAGLIVSVLNAGLLGRAWPLRALGRTALTTYSLQSILTSLLFYGLGWLGAFGFAGLMVISAVIWVLTGLFASWWLRTHDMGPMEAVLRAVAYGSFRRRRAQAAAALATSPPL